MTVSPTLRALLPAAIVLMGAGSGAFGHDEPETQSLFELVRAYKATQNRLAYGDQTALKATAEQAVTIGGWLEHATPEAWKEERNVRALVIFLLGGGGIGAGSKSLEEAKLEERDRELVESALLYSVGKLADSAPGLSAYNPLELEPILGAHVALAQAMQLVDRDPKKAAALLDQSALLAPGTLIEEASLRRRAIIAASSGRPRDLGQAIEVYTRRFENSIFRQALIATIQKVLASREIESVEELEEITAAVVRLTDVEQLRILLKLAEGALRLARLDLVRTASERAVATALQNSQELARAELYRTVSQVLLEKMGDDRTSLESIEHQNLSAEDEMLLEVAKRIKGALTAATSEADEEDREGDRDVPAIVTKARAMLADADTQIGRR